MAKRVKAVDENIDTVDVVDEVLEVDTEIEEAIIVDEADSEEADEVKPLKPTKRMIMFLTNVKYNDKLLSVGNVLMVSEEEAFEYVKLDVAKIIE